MTDASVVLRNGVKSFRVENLKVAFAKGYEPVITHTAKLFGKCCPVKIQIVRHMLTVKGNVKLSPVRFHGNTVQVSTDSAAGGFRRCMKTALGQYHILMDRNKHKISKQLDQPGWGGILQPMQTGHIKQRDSCLLIGAHIHIGGLLRHDCKDLCIVFAGGNMTDDGSVSPDIVAFDRCAPGKDQSKVIRDITRH